MEKSMNLKEMLRAFHEDEQALAATEYLLILILVACMGMAIVMTFGRTSQRKFARSSTVIGENQDFGLVGSN